MAATEKSAQSGPADVPGPVEDRNAANTDRGRRWYHPRPQPRCRADVMGFNYTFWFFLVLLLVIVVLPW
jgi:hypothetical protein